MGIEHQVGSRSVGFHQHSAGQIEEEKHVSSGRRNTVIRLSDMEQE